MRRAIISDRIIVIKKIFVSTDPGCAELRNYLKMCPEQFPPNYGVKN